MHNQQRTSAEVRDEAASAEFGYSWISYDRSFGLPITYFSAFLRGVAEYEWDVGHRLAHVVHGS